MTDDVFSLSHLTRSLSPNVLTPEPHEESFMSVGLQFPVETFREKATFGGVSGGGFIKT